DELARPALGARAELEDQPRLDLGDRLAQLVRGPLARGLVPAKHGVPEPVAVVPEPLPELGLSVGRLHDGPPEAEQEERVVGRGQPHATVDCPSARTEEQWKPGARCAVSGLAPLTSIQPEEHPSAVAPRPGSSERVAAPLPVSRGAQPRLTPPSCPLGEPP